MADDNAVEDTKDSAADDDVGVAAVRLMVMAISSRGLAIASPYAAVADPNRQYCYHPLSAALFVAVQRAEETTLKKCGSAITRKPGFHNRSSNYLLLGGPLLYRQFISKSFLYINFNLTIRFP